MILGTVEMIAMAVITAGVFGRLWMGTHSSRVYRQVKPSAPHPAKKRPEEVALLADCGDAVGGKYLSWPIPATIGLGLAGLASSAVGSGGHPAGFAVAYALNPLNWLMVWAFFQIGKIGCPHCRRAVTGGSIRNAAIGTGLRCTQCGNVFNKPAA